MSVDLKLKALDIAKEKFDGPHVLQAARDIYDWLYSDQQGGVSTPAAEVKQEVIERAHLMPDLNRKEKDILRLCIKWYIEGTKITGTRVAKDMSMTQSNGSAYLEKLRKKGYIRREGTKIKFTPVFYPDGKRVETVLVKVPPGKAQGYKGYSQKVADVATIKQ